MTPKKNIDKEENKSSVKSNRKSSLRLSQKNENMTPKESDTMKMEDVTLINSIKKRLSRKSVVFDGKNLQTYMYVIISICFDIHV